MRDPRGRPEKPIDWDTYDFVKDEGKKFRRKDRRIMGRIDELEPTSLAHKRLKKKHWR